MESQTGWRHRFLEWASGHALWEVARHLAITIGAAWIGSYGVARLMHAAIDTAANVFLLCLGSLGVGWGIGLLPITKTGKLSIVRDTLKSRCDALILGWKELDRDYQNARKNEYDPVTLQDPMSPVWVSSEWKVWPYRIGVLQGKTNTLREDLVREGIEIEEWDSRMSMPKLLHELEKYKLEIS